MEVKKVKIFEVKRYFAIALDPVHIGTGGYRIGRVDNTIVREPATGIPKIPATTIEGVCRNYAYLRTKESGINIDPVCAKGKPKSDTEQPCGKCEICITFGFSRKDKSMQAMALFSDARILFFPVATMIGPVWITSPITLKDTGINDFQEPNSEKFITPLPVPENKLNFGWLLLKKDSNKTVANLNFNGISEEILNRIVIVPDDLFSTIVNSNLEVRTSVAIDPATGAAEERALFTYEAIPRGTIFWFDVTYQNPKHFELDDWEIPLIVKTVEDGFSLFEHLGVGGMGSRGFGRLRIIGDFIPFEEYLNALAKRLKSLKERGKIDKITEVCNYLKNLKSTIKENINNLQKIIDKNSAILEELC